jgi:putative SOS response-associated peptidase YedK
MCHHYRGAKNLPAEFVEEYHITPDQRAHYAKLLEELRDGAWPTKVVPALRLDAAGELEVFSAEWGLLPRWWKPSDKQPKRAAFQRGTFNARSETAASKPTFREAMKKRRCLIPVEEFHENGFYFGVPQGDEFQPLAFAGLWESWQGEEGEILTVSFLTTEPNKEVASVGHDRMPILLETPENRRRWLVDGANGPHDPLLRPFFDGWLSIRPK